MHGKTIAFVAGIAAGIVAGMSSPFGSELATAALTLGVVQGVIYAVLRKRETKGLALSLFTSLLCIAFFIGVVRVQMIGEKTPYLCEDVCTFEGVIVSSPESKDAFQTFLVRPHDKEENAYDILVRTSPYPEYKIGERLTLRGKVKEPDVIFPHGDRKSFDYLSYLHTKDVGSEMLFPKVEALGDGEVSVGASLGRWKGELVARVNAYVSSPENALASGMLFGNSAMSGSLVDTFRVAGLSHIVVLSGFNIAIVITFILFVFAFLPLALRIALAAISVLVFVAMVGGEASVVRATLMSFVGLIAIFIGREYVARQALMLSFLAIIVYDPSALTDSVSLHLSFLATAGIVYGSEAIKSIVNNFISKKFFVELLTTTVAAYLATLPYIMHTFGTVSAYALIANALALPLVPLAMLLSFLVVAASYASHTIALLFGFADSHLLGAIIYVAEMVGRLPGSYFSFTISLPMMLVAYLFIASSLLILVRKKKDETPHTLKGGFLTDVIPY